MNLTPSFEPQNVDSKWYARWMAANAFSPREEGPAFTIILPPPNVTGKLHEGHALDVTIQDSLIRFKRMQGYSANWIPGIDHAGIATQVVVEKLLYQRDKKLLRDYTREQFLQEIWRWKEEYAQIICDQLKSMGASLNWDLLLFTMDPLPQQAVNEVFRQYYEQGLIYKSDYIVNWDPQLQSAISDLEVVFKPVKGAFYYIKYTIQDSDQYLTIATTRPETLFGDTAIAVHPEDERFKGLIGKYAIVPLAERVIPIIGDSYVDMALGTGQLKVTPAHDFNDFNIGKNHHLPAINILNKDGTLNSEGMEFAGLKCADARPLVVEKLKKLNLLLKVEEYTHEVGHGDRSGVILEPMISSQWFLNIEQMAQEALRVVNNGEIKFLPQGWINTYNAWLNDPKPWCISRQLIWGHRIPIFYCNSCQHIWFSTNAQNCPHCQSKDIHQDEDVLDTWFSSALWPMVQLGWPNPTEMNKRHFTKYFPTSVMVTGFDIIFFWVARMIMSSLKFTQKIPFAEVYFHPIIRDEQGRKISKSLNNGVDPIQMIAQYGADAFRLSLISGAGYGRTINMGEARINHYKFFLNKIWNAFRFISPYLAQRKNFDLTKIEDDPFAQWILNRLNKLIVSVTQNIEIFRFDEVISAIYTFIYDDFCSIFIEQSKIYLSLDKYHPRIDLLIFVFEHILKLLHPFAPFITEELNSYLSEHYLITSTFPTALPIDFTDKEKEVDQFIKILTNIRNLRSSLNLSPKEKISVTLQGENIWQSYLKTFTVMANLETITLNPPTLPQENTIVGAQDNCTIYLTTSNITSLQEYKKRTNNDLLKWQKELNKLQAKLNNEQFNKQAPPAIVEEVHSKYRQLQKKIEQLQLNTKLLH